MKKFTGNLSIRSLLLFVCCVFLSGCTHSLFAVSQQKKSELLSKRLDEYHAALYWGAENEAVQSVDPNWRREFEQLVRNRKKNEKLVDFNIEDVKMGANGEEAEVVVSSRFVSKASYLVETRREREFWGFDRFNDGWSCFGSEVIVDGEKS